MPKQQEPLGESWWAQRWLGLLVGFDRANEARLTRGRAFARDGRVFQVVVSQGLVEAETQGSSYLVPNATAITVAPLTDADWERVIAALAGQTHYVARLLAGEMPPEIEDVFAAAGVSLLPQRPGELAADCPCREEQPMCKHVAAVHYVLAANLDAQPFLLFTLRGREMDEVLAQLRERWSGAGAGQEGDEESPPAVTPPEESLLAPLRAADFYHAGPELDELSIAIAPPQVEAALLKRLGRPPFAAKDEDPLPALTSVYAAVTKRALAALGRSGERRRQGDA